MRIFVRSFRVPLGVPYWNAETYRAVLRSFLRRRVVDGPDLGALKSLLVQSLGVEYALLCGSGSLALEIALSACGVRQGDEVVIPSFCCTAVVPPVLSVGAVPVFADVDEDLNISSGTVDRVLTKKTKAVIVPHLFGNPADIQSIINLARSAGIRVIDDAAQALGAAINGQPVGSFGDAGILSFGSDKVCFGLGGGVLVSRKNEILNENLKIELALPRAIPAAENFVSTLVWRRWRRWTLPAQPALSRLKTPDPESPPDPYRRESMANLNAAVALSLTRALHENIAARRARGRAYHELLGNESGLKLIPHGAGSACLTQVIRVLPGRRAEDLALHLLKVLRNKGYEVQGSYVPTHLLARCAEWARDPLPYTERVWPDLIELPCEPGISLEHVERIASIIKSAYLFSCRKPSRSAIAVGGKI